jgi:hypothetical protein
MVMDFSWGWVKPGTVMTEPQAKVRLELARPAMRHPFARIRTRLEMRGQGLQAPLPVPAFRA